MASTAAVKSAIRVIEIFEYFESAREPRSLKEIIDDLQYPQSSSTVLLKNLISLGYLSYDCRTRKYFPTPRLARLGDWVAGELYGQGQVLKLMNDLHTITGDLIGLGIQNDVHLQYIRVIQSTYSLPYFVPEGNMRLITQSAGGWILLAQQPMRKIEYTVRRANMAATCPEERVAVSEFLDRMQQIKRDGYAYAENIPFVDAATLCIPLPISLKGQPAAMGIAGRLERMRPRAAMLTEFMRRAASSLTDESPSLDLTTLAAELEPASASKGKTERETGARRTWFDALGDYNDLGVRQSAHA